MMLRQYVSFLSCILHASYHQNSGVRIAFSKKFLNIIKIRLQDVNPAIASIFLFTLLYLVGGISTRGSICSAVITMETHCLGTFPGEN